MEKQEFDKLVSELQTGNVQQRRSASYKLGNSKNNDVVPTLIQAYSDMDGSVRQNAIEGLRKIRSQEAIEFLISKQISIPQPTKAKTSPLATRQFLVGFLGWFILSFIINIFITFYLFDNLFVINLFSSTHVDKIGITIDNPQAVEFGNIASELFIQLVGYSLAFLAFLKNKRLASLGIILASAPYLVGFVLRSGCMPPGLPFPLSLMSC
jgi:hypothetical protein